MSFPGLVDKETFFNIALAALFYIILHVHAIKERKKAGP